MEQSSLETTRASRVEFVDGLRALAALFVLFHHSWLIIWPIGYQRFPTGIAESLTTWLSYGHFAVTFFIVISGFCLGLPIARKGAAGWRGTWQFYGRRARRILPPYYASIFVIGLLILTVIGTRTGTHWDSNSKIDFGRVGYLFLLINNIVGGNQINSVYWSIAVEWQIYLLFPILVWIWLRFGVAWSALLAVIIGYTAALLTNGTPYQLITGQYLAMFAIGYCTAYVYEKRTWRQTLSKIPWLAIAVVLIAAVTLILRPVTLGLASPFFLWWDIPVGLAAGCLLMAGCLRDRYVTKILCSPTLQKIGAFSFSLYLLHMPMVQIVWQYCIRPYGFPDYVQFILIVVLGAPVALLASYVFYWLVERHFVSDQKPSKPEEPTVTQSLATETG